MCKIYQLFDLEKSLAGKYLSCYDYPWEALEGFGAFIRGLGNYLDTEEYFSPSRGVWLHRTVEIDPTARIDSPCILGAGTKVRHGAFIRGNVLVGENCVIGNSTELKNSILFDGAKAPHFNYVGDSILGFNAHLGAGAITSNVRSDGGLVTVKCGEKRMDTGRRKVGAFVGDFAEIGCNSVLNPGTVIGKNTMVYPLSSVRGSVAENCIYKSCDCVEKRR